MLRRQVLSRERGLRELFKAEESLPYSGRDRGGSSGRLFHHLRAKNENSLNRCADTKGFTRWWRPSSSRPGSVLPDLRMPQLAVAAFSPWSYYWVIKVKVISFTFTWLSICFASLMSPSMTRGIAVVYAGDLQGLYQAD